MCSSRINPISFTPSTEYLIFPIPQAPKLLLHSNLSFHSFFPLPVLFLVQFSHHSHQPQLGALAEVGAGPLPIEPGNITVSFLSYFLSLKSRWFSFSALQCQLIHQAASGLILDKTLSLPLPAFHKASMYPIKFVVLFPDKNELIGNIYYLLYFFFSLHHIFVPVHIFSEVIKNPALWL